MPLDPLTMSLIGSAAGAGQDLLSGVLGWAVNAQQNKKSREFTKSMAEYAYEKDLEQWNRQNEYNSPASQMQRLKDAGLNPMLMYGQGTTGNASGSPTYRPPEGKFGGFENLKFRTNPISDFIDLQTKAKNVDLLNEQVTIAKANADIALSEAAIKRVQSEMWYPGQMTTDDFTWWRDKYKSLGEYQLQMLEKQVKEKEENIGLLIQKQGLTDVQKQMIAKDLQMFKDSGLSMKDPVWARILYQIFGPNDSLIKAILNGD